MPTQKFVTHKKSSTENKTAEKPLKTPKKDSNQESDEKMERSEDMGFFKRIVL